VSLVARTSGRRDPDGSRDSIGDQPCVLVVFEDVSDRIPSALPDYLLHDLRERPVSDALPVWNAAPDQNSRAGLDHVVELLDEARLPDTGWAEHR